MLCHVLFKDSTTLNHYTLHKHTLLYMPSASCVKLDHRPDRRIAMERTCASVDVSPAYYTSKTQLVAACNPRSMHSNMQRLTLMVRMYGSLKMMHVVNLCLPIRISFSEHRGSTCLGRLDAHSVAARATSFLCGESMWMYYCKR